MFPGACHSIKFLGLDGFECSVSIFSVTQLLYSKLGLRRLPKYLRPIKYDPQSPKK